MSAKKDDLKKQYRESKKADHHWQVCRACGERGMKSELEPHHPKGRHGENILEYFWIHPACHRWIHDNPKEATQMGLLKSGRNI
jgi:hypothetical protein